jgi:hypothetical protein
MNYPHMRKCDRGSREGRPEIVFSENQGWEEAQVFAEKAIEYLKLNLDRRIDGPDAWLWEVHNANGRFTFGYDDYPCETTLVASDVESDAEIESIYIKSQSLKIN